MLLRIFLSFLIAAVVLTKVHSFGFGTRMRRFAIAGATKSYDLAITAAKSQLTAQSSTSLYMSSPDTPTTSAAATPGKPVVRRLDEEANVAYMTVAISGEQTDRAFKKSCAAFNEVNIRHLRQSIS